MGQSAEELTGDIEATRARMATDLDTLQDRVSPSAIVERRKQAARTQVASLRDRVMGSADGAQRRASGTASSAADTAQERFEGNPLGAGLLAFGAGLVLASLLPATRAEAEAAHQVMQTAQDRGLVDQAKESGQHVADHLKESATEAVQQVKESAQDSASTVQAEGRSAAENVRDQAPGS